MENKTIIFEIKPWYRSNTQLVLQAIDRRGLKSTDITLSGEQIKLTVEDGFYRNALDKLNSMDKYGYITDVNGHIPARTITFRGFRETISDVLFDKIKNTDWCTIIEEKVEGNVLVKISVNVKDRKKLYALLNGIEDKLR